uniref:Uncharacterized protein n=1 Tax=Ditylenchus dipsaci TaxID=166011 RepID=A0A915ET18_9BILA
MSVNHNSDDFMGGWNSIQSSPAANQGKKRYKYDLWNSFEDVENPYRQKVLMCKTCWNLNIQLLSPCYQTMSTAKCTLISSRVFWKSSLKDVSKVITNNRAIITIFQNQN